MNEHQCCGKVFQSYALQSFQCSRKGKYEREGKWYCGQHDPVRVKDRREKRDRKWQAKAEAHKAQRKAISYEAGYEAGLIEGKKQALEGG